MERGDAHPAEKARLLLGKVAGEGRIVTGKDEGAADGVRRRKGKVGRWELRCVGLVELPVLGASILGGQLFCVEKQVLVLAVTLIGILLGILLGVIRGAVVVLFVEGCG
eukprot:scaffold32258_cov54-Phaeocystis_antarctica.AAC.1